MGSSSIKAMGFTECASLFVESWKSSNSIREDSAIITNPDAKIEDRVKAYNHFAELERQFSGREGLEKTSAFMTAAKEKLDLYMKSVPLVVPNIGSGDSFIPLKIEGKPATMFDLVSAINGNPNLVLTVDAHFNEADASIRKVDWVDSGWVRDSINRKGSAGRTCSNGVKYDTSECGGCTKDCHFGAAASISVWKQYAVGKIEDSNKQAKESFNDFINYISK